MLNCKQKIKHMKAHPDHEEFLQTSAKYASEKQIISLALACNKFVKKDSEEFMISPYGPSIKTFQNLNQ